MQIQDVNNFHNALMVNIKDKFENNNNNKFEIN